MALKAEPGLASEVDLALKAELEAEALLVRKYGGLPRSNPLIAHSLKAGKHYFDSGDYARQQQLGQSAGMCIEDQSQLPLAYDHHAQRLSEAEGYTSQPPGLDRRPGGAGAKASRSGQASPRREGAGPSGA